MDKIVTIKDFEEHSKKKLSKQVVGYYYSGANDQITLNQNVSALQRIRLNPKILIDVSKLSMKTKILGREVNFPFGIAPTAMHKLAHQEGEKIVARLAYQNNMCITLSNLSSTGLSEFAAQNKTGMRFLQIYILKNRSYTQKLIHLAEQQGYSALVVTVDTQSFGKRIIDVKNKFSPDWFNLEVFKEVGVEIKFREKQQKDQHKSFIGNIDPSLDWSFISWLKKITHLPIILKGIISVQDALLANQYGVQAIWVSNHGGRQLDTVLPTILALPRIVKELKKINSKMEIYADGGVRKGTDIFKFLALGADYVFLGRGILFSLVQGYEGVKKALEIYESELKTTMMLCGTSSISQINENYILKSRKARL